MKEDKTKSFKMDCIDFMKDVPDKFYDLAIVDPPYGIGFSDYERGSSSIKVKKRYTKNGKKQWDSDIPADKYFNELFRISKNQIIWGGNYFNLPPTQCFVFWFKQNPVPNFADGEFAWTSFNKPAKCFDYRYYGNLEGKTSNQSDKFHPTQKPVKLYEWLLMNYAKEGDKILDTHGGSQSSRIACFNLGFELDIIELDKEYYDSGNKRFEQHKAQLRLF